MKLLRHFFSRTLEEYISLGLYALFGGLIAMTGFTYTHSGPGSMMVTTLAFRVDDEVRAGGHLDVALKIERKEECQIESTYELWHDADFYGEPHRRTFIVGNANGPLTRVGTERVLLSWAVPAHIPPGPGWHYSSITTETCRILGFWPVVNIRRFDSAPITILPANAYSPGDRQ